MRQSLRASQKAQAASTASPSPVSEPTDSEHPNGETQAEATEKSTPTEGSDSAAAPVENGAAKWTFREIVNHRWNGNDIELQIHWDDPDDVTWEPEKAIHRDAKSALISYWSSQPGGRPLNPQDPDSFTIFAFKGVRSPTKGQRQILVEWVGWAKPTWEPEQVIKKTAPKALKAYLRKRVGRQ